MRGAIARTEELIATTPNAWMPEQFDTHANAELLTASRVLTFCYATGERCSRWTGSFHRVEPRPPDV